jgi:hypothetical protein
LAINLIQESSKTERCAEHRSQLDLICVDCKSKICNKCVFKGTHKDHKVEIHEDYIQSLKTKVKDVELWAKAMDSACENVKTMVETKRKNLIWMIDLKFN